MAEAKGSTRRDYKRKMQQRAEQLKEPQPGDEAVGSWCEQDLREMQLKFEQAIARELRPKR
jgi:hypothetical protein